MSYDLDQNVLQTAFKRDPTIIFILGKPFSGRGTFCSKIVKEFGFTHISLSGIFREEIKKGSNMGDDLKN